MRRPRFTLRWLMLLVLLVALLLFGEQMRRVRNHRLLKADSYRQDERKWRRQLEGTSELAAERLAIAFRPT